MVEEMAKDRYSGQKMETLESKRDTMNLQPRLEIQVRGTTGHSKAELQSRRTARAPAYWPRPLSHCIGCETNRQCLKCLLHTHATGSGRV